MIGREKTFVKNGVNYIIIHEIESAQIDGVKLQFLETDKNYQHGESYIIGFFGENLPYPNMIKIYPKEKFNYRDVSLIYAEKLIPEILAYDNDDYHHDLKDLRLDLNNAGFLPAVDIIAAMDSHVAKLPVTHITHTGYYAGTPICGIDKAKAMESGQNFAHWASHVENSPYFNICSPCQDILDNLDD